MTREKIITMSFQDPISTPQVSSSMPLKKYIPRYWIGSGLGEKRVDKALFSSMLELFYSQQALSSPGSAPGI